MLRVFAEHGDRTDRKKARLCYLIDRLGTETFLGHVQAKLPFRLRHVSALHCSPRPPVDRHGHVGIHPQAQPGLASIGIVIPVGRMSAEQMLGLARLADMYGEGELRLTVWQNVVLPNVPEPRVQAAVQAIAAVGYDVRTSAFSGGLVSCTGNIGCRFSATDTKGHALELARHLERRFELESPINIHLTGCPNSCAQHAIADIGLLGTAVPSDAGSAQGYHVFIGGGAEQLRGLGRELARNVPFAGVAGLLERLLQGYQDRRSVGETFVDFARRHDIQALRDLTGVTSE
jgi:ferredoxin-nitrite reductase